VGVDSNILHTYIGSLADRSDFTYMSLIHKVSHEGQYYIFIPEKELNSCSVEFIPIQMNCLTVQRTEGRLSRRKRGCHSQVSLIDLQPYVWVSVRFRYFISSATRFILPHSIVLPHTSQRTTPFPIQHHVNTGYRVYLVFLLQG
jgi:hypothetical protein